MSPVKVNEDLQSQSKLLLQRLKTKQGLLKSMVESDEAMTEKNVGKINKGSASKARQKLSASNKKKVSSAKRGKKDMGTTEPKSFNAKNDSDVTSRKSLINNTEDDHCVVCYPGKRFNESAVDTPKTARRRIIDKNIHVESNLDDKYLSEKMKNLNFDYSHLNDNDEFFVSNSIRHRPGTNDSGKFDNEWKYRQDRVSAASLQDFDRRLPEDLNMRREDSYPKSILSSLRSKDNSKSCSKVSFLNSSTSSSYERSKRLWNNAADDRRLLGYDWIAALMENDPSVINQSEAFFDDIKEFRQANREECVNSFYVDGPGIHESLQKVEDETVIKALENTKVKPYTINERLFTVPISNKLLSGDDDEHDRSPERDGTREDPRFVRVSIPRSTLMSTYQVKPHRRRSFDPTDAVSLSEHCLLGWENSCPSMLPSASNVGITDASEGVKSKLATPPSEDYLRALSQTLAEAEKIASNFDRPFISPDQSRPNYSHLNSFKYRNLGIDNSSLSLSRTVNQTTDQTGSISQDIKKKTDDLLNTTYSLMFELERLRKEREFTSGGKSGQKAS